MNPKDATQHGPPNCYSALEHYQMKIRAEKAELSIKLLQDTVDVYMRRLREAHDALEKARLSK